MNSITFPFFNLTFNINPVAFSVFNISVYWYAIIIVFGMIFGFAVARFNKNNYGIKFDDVLMAAVFAIIVGFIGARLYFVLFNLSSYLDNPMKVIYIRDGGLAIYGGLIGGTLAIICYCKNQKIDFWNFVDYIIPSIPIAQAIGRFGNFVNMEAYGYETTSFLRMGIKTAQGYLEVHPTFLYESFCNLIIFLFLIFLQKKRSFKGEIALGYLLMYSAIRFFIEGLRADSLMLFNMRISQILSLIIFLVSFILYVCRKKYHENAHKN